MAVKIKELNNANIFFTALIMLCAVILYRYNSPGYYLYYMLGVYFVFVFLLRIDSRIPIGAALALLLITPFLLIRNLENYANYTATLAYFLLVIGVIKQFAEYLKEKPDKIPRL